MTPARREALGHILWDGLAGMPARTRRVLRLRYLECRDVAAIARDLAVDEGTVRRLLAEGHGALRRTIAPTLRTQGYL